MTTSYHEELAGLVMMGPQGMERSLLDYARAIRVTLQEEQEKASPDNALVALLCDAARLGAEYLDHVAKRGTLYKIDDLIAKLQDVRAKFGNTSVVLRTAAWGATALWEMEKDKMLDGIIEKK